MKSNKFAVIQIKKLLFLDNHLCPDCSWSGSTTLLISSASNRSKLCPICNSLQFSNQDPTLRQRLERAESMFIHLKTIGEIEENQLCFKSERKFLLNSIIKNFNLDEDGAFDLCLRIKELD
jgi:hypothetical protein